jgi:hypothetical protein
MAAPETTKFQVNYKLADGTLVNLYATDVRDLETGLTDLQMVSTLIASTADSFRGNAAPAAVHNPAPAVASAPASAGNVCKHGPMSFREGVGAKGPWKGWMCAAPKGAVDKCQTIWVR